jgi:hypothetical protein
LRENDTVPGAKKEQAVRRKREGKSNYQAQAQSTLLPQGCTLPSFAVVRSRSAFFFPPTTKKFSATFIRRGKSKENRDIWLDYIASGTANISFLLLSHVCEEIQNQPSVL